MTAVWQETRIWCQVCGQRRLLGHLSPNRHEFWLRCPTCGNYNHSDDAPSAGLAWDDMSVIEINEAFASVVLQSVKDTGLGGRMDDVNPNGGGISLGHPLGATGARITATLLNELERRGGRYGLASMCIGQGQAIAAVIERL